MRRLMFGSMERSKRDLERSGLDLIRNRVTCDTWYCLMAAITVFVLSWQPTTKGGV